MSDNYPQWVCTICAEKAGGKVPEGHLHTWHNGICPCCGHVRVITQPRDFCYPKLEEKYEYKVVDILGRTSGEREDSVDGDIRPEREAK